MNSYSRVLHSFSFNESDLDSSGLLTSKAVPSSHYSQQGFTAYKKAQVRNRKLNLFADFEDSFEIMHVPKLIQAELSPTSKAFVTSRFPAAPLSSDLEQKISMLNAYHHLEELRDVKPKKSVILRHSSTSVRNKAQKDSELDLLKRQLTRDDCRECRRTSCRCVQTAPDKYLQRMNRLLIRARRSTSQATAKPLQRSRSKAQSFRPQTSKSAIKKVPSNYLHDRPQRSKLLSLTAIYV
jgi:hypothetical protein